MAPTWMAFATSVRCVRTAIFGMPVVPPVQKYEATSSSAGASNSRLWSGTNSSSWCRSSTGMRPTLCGIRSARHGCFTRRPRQVSQRRDREDGFEALHILGHAGDLLPDVGARGRRERDEEPGLHGCHQLPQHRGLQEGVEREHAAGGFAAPDHPVRFGEVGQNIGHRVAAAEAEATQQVGRLRDARDPLAVRPHEGLLEIDRLQEERQRGRFGVPLGTALQQCIGAAAVGERLGEVRLEGSHVLWAAHGGRRRSSSGVPVFMGGILGMKVTISSL